MQLEKKSKKKVFFILGTRPEALKLYPLIKYFKTKKKFSVKTISTSQHTNLLKDAFSNLSFKADIDLKLMTKNQSLLRFINKSSIKIDEVIKKYNPDLVFVQGDTGTAYSAAIASFLNKVPIAHIEAGLRTQDIINPFPEEIYRRLITKMTSFHFAPTSMNKKNLLKDGVNKNNIYVTGNTIIDTLKFINIKISSEKQKYNNYFKKYKFNFTKIILVTIHRRENHNENIKKFINILKKLSKFYPDYNFILPYHPNPNVKNILLKNFKKNKNIYIIKPLKYDKMIFLIQKSKLILTDSGGIQEEAPYFGVPVLILRQTTERLEGIKEKVAFLTGINEKKIIFYFRKILENKIKIYTKKNIYGNGNTSKLIYKITSKIL